MGRRKTQREPRRVLMSVDGHEEPEFVIEHALGAVKAPLFTFVAGVLNADEARGAQWAKVRVDRSSKSGLRDAPTPEDARALLKDIGDHRLQRYFLEAFTARLAGGDTGAKDLMRQIEDRRFIKLCNKAVHGERVSVNDAIDVVETLAALADAIGAPVEALHLQAPLATLRERAAWKGSRKAPAQTPVKAGVTCVGVHWVQPRRVVPGSWWIVGMRDGADAVVEVDLTSSQVVDFLMTLDTPVIAGLAFCFSAPETYVQREHAGDVTGLWRWCAQVAGTDDRDEISRELPAPFRHVEPHETLRRPAAADAMHFRSTERAVFDQLGVEPASLFDVGGEGSVGALAIKGMPILAALRQRGAAIWPMDPPALVSGVTCVEIFPRSLWTSIHPAESPRSKKNVMRRWNFIADRRDEGVIISEARAKEIAEDERAFDALLTAWALRRYAGTLQQVGDSTALTEGLIWLPG